MMIYFIQNMLYKPPFKLLLRKNNIVCMVGQNNHFKYDGFNICQHICVIWLKWVLLRPKGKK